MKTKVIAFRVTQEEYDALVYMAQNYDYKVGEFVYNCLDGALLQGSEGLWKQRKKAEAKAKRDAKKAAANGAQ